MNLKFHSDSKFLCSMCSTYQLVGPILKLEVKRQEVMCAFIEKDPSFENHQFHIAIVHPISLHMPQYYNIAIRIPRTTILPRLNLQALQVVEF